MTELDKTKNQSNHFLYENLSWLYELVFKPFFIGATKRTMKLIRELRPEYIVEVGVGTGYSLAHYPPGTNIVGLEVSQQMVQASRKRAQEISDKNIEIYNIADLPESSLDEIASVVVSFSVITVVDDPQNFLNDLKSYCSSGGHILLVMHSRSSGLAKIIDHVFDPITKLLFGFTLLRKITDYNLEGLELVEIKPISRFLLYPYSHLVVLKKK